jgi:hypothetical protein
MTRVDHEVIAERARAAVTLETLIQDVLGSNLYLHSIYQEILTVFLNPPAKFRGNILTRHRSLPSKSLPIHHSSVVLSLDAVQSDAK